MNEKGLFFYKLISPYIEDITKNCKLTVNEIDSNFLTLKDADIKEIKVGEDGKTLILVRNDGNEITTSPGLDFIKDLDVVWQKEEGKLTIKCDEEEFVIDGIITNEDLHNSVIHDSTLKGSGTFNKALGISLTDVTGMYAPVIRVIDITGGGALPETATIGDRYLTCEWVSNHGYLYNYSGVTEIAENLTETSSEWRVPTKSDWDALLNSIEPCDYKNHDSEDCHVVLGKYAGKKLKSVDGWKEWTNEPYVDSDGLEHLPIQPNGTDEFGFTVLPLGTANEEEEIEFKTERVVFWSTSHIKTPEHDTEAGDSAQDIYVKVFDYKESGVIQEANCPENFYSLRLVKDFNGSNYMDSEVINGIPYKTLLFTEPKQIWLATNFVYPTNEGKLTPEDGTEVEKKKAYFINSFNGEIWEKKQLSEGESIVVNNTSRYDNEEYRIFYDEFGNQTLVAVDDAVYERILEIVLRLIGEEAQARESADTQLRNNLNDEAQTREAADIQLTNNLNGEIDRAQRNEEAILGEIIDNPTNRQYEDTPKEYVINLNSGDESPNITLFSKGGSNNIDIFVNCDFGEI